jgi:hypothetical protein
MILGIGIGIPFGRRGGASFTGVLDLYPNAALAYSLRKLRKAYTGAAVRIRRSGDNTESDIGFLANGDFDSAAAVSFCGAGNGFITTWYDQSGNAINVTQTTAANQPQIVASGVIILQNAKPAVQFDGTNDRLITGTFAIINQPFSTFSVSKENLLNRAIIGSATNTINRQFVLYPVGGNYALFNGANASSLIPVTTNQKIICTVSNSPNGILSLNNTQVGSLNSGTSSLQDFQISGYYDSAQFLDGNVQEVILYPNNQSGNLSAIRTLINSYYGIY